jgi:metal-responsive CopG/Arc/MetJ family transcriptional regulator|tara:strand:- start:20 stop:316 length:297 start_codon:yes stop_codon:yes gene_type:complete
MSRRRSTDKHQPLTISVPSSMMSRLDQELSYKQSRSKWVQAAIKAKLESKKAKDQVISDISNIDLIGMLFSRKIISSGMYEELYFKAKKLTEETAGEQ